MDTLVNGLEPSDFQALGIERAGHQKKLIVAIEELIGSGASPNAKGLSGRTVRMRIVRRSQSSKTGNTAAVVKEEWIETKDEKGRKYYWNPKTRETSWTNPNEAPPPPPDMDSQQSPEPQQAVQKKPKREEGAVELVKPVKLTLGDKSCVGKKNIIICVHKARKMTAGTSYVKVSTVDGKGKVIYTKRTSMLSHMDAADFSEAFALPLVKHSFRLKVEIVQAESDKVVAGMHFDVPKKWQEFVQENPTIEKGTWFQIGKAAQVRLIVLSNKIDKKDPNGEAIMQLLNALLSSSRSRSRANTNSVSARNRSNSRVHTNSASPSLAQSTLTRSHTAKGRPATVRLKDKSLNQRPKLEVKEESPVEALVEASDALSGDVLRASDIEQCLDSYFGKLLQSPDTWQCAVVSLKHVGASPQWSSLYHVTVEWDSIMKGTPRKGRSNFTVGKSADTQVVSLISKGFT